MRSRVLYFLIFLVCVACSTEESVEPADANTFYKLFGGPNLYRAHKVLETPENDLVILGTSIEENDDGTETSKIRVIKTDKNGNTIWDKLYPSDEASVENYRANSFIITEDQGYLIVGDRIYANGKTGTLLLKLNTMGEQQQINDLAFVPNQDTLSSHGIDLVVKDNELKITSKIESASENIFVGTVNPSSLEVLTDCSFRYSSGSTNPAIVKSLTMENNGDLVFAASVNSNSRLIRVPQCQNTQITGPLVQSTSSQSYLINQIVKNAVGYVMVGTTNENNNDDLFIARVSDYGDNAKVKIYTEIDGIQLTEEENGYTISTTNDGGLIIGGSTLSQTAGELDMLVIKTDNIGNVQWSKRYGDQNEESARYITQASDGGYLILGNTEFGGIDTIVLIKTDKEGEVN